MLFRSLVGGETQRWGDARGAERIRGGEKEFING